MLFKALISILLLVLSACDRRQDLALLSASAQDEPAELYLHHRPDHVPDGLLAEFQKETGIKVYYHPFDTSEELEARLANRQTGYDIVVPRASFAKAQIEQGLFQPLDLTRLPGLAQIDRRVMAGLAQADPGNRHLVPWSWSFTAVGINQTRVKQALAGLRLPDNSWELVFNPAYTRKLRACGVVYRDSASEILPAALHYLGLDPYSDQPDDYQKAARLLAQVRADVRSFSRDLAQELSENRACVVIGPASEIGSAASQARDGGSSEGIEALLPGSGLLAWFDAMAIPADAPHPGNAHKFIEFVLRPDNAARLIAELNLNPGNNAARKLVSSSSASSPSLFLPEDQGSQPIAQRRVSADAADAAEQVFSAFRRGGVSPGPRPH